MDNSDLIQKESPNETVKDNIDSVSKTEKTYNYFYKITNKLNGRFYYGIHTTNNLNDKYFGSGTAITLAVKKYGKDNFMKENLKFFSTAEEALEYEAKIVDYEMINDPMCYNIVLGGGKLNRFGKVFVKDKNGNRFCTDVNDPRYLNGELILDFSGRVHIMKINDSEIINKYVIKNELDTYLEEGWVTGSQNKGKIWIHLKSESNVIDRRMINPKDLDKYINLGWNHGIGPLENSGSISGYIYLYRVKDDGKKERAYVPPENLSEYLKLGWKEGSELKGTKRIYRILPDGTRETKAVPKEEYDSFISNGWKQGYGDDNSKRYSINKGRKRIYKKDSDGSIRLSLVPKEKLNDFLKSGWELGYIQPKQQMNYIMVSKKLSSGGYDVDVVYIPESLLDKYLSNGYRKGKLK